MGWEIIIPTVLNAVGIGISVAGQAQAAKQSQQIARYNYAMQMQQARQQQQMALFQQQATNQQARVIEAQASINNALAQQEAQARLNNAAALRQQAEVQAGNDRQNLMNQRLDQKRQLALQRSRIAKTGVLESASALESLVESVGLMQQSLEESHYQSELEHRRTLGAAAMEEFGGKIASAGAEAQLAAGRAEADFTRLSAAFEGAKGAAALSQGQREARISLLTGDAQAQGARIGAVGSLFSGLGSIGSQWTSWRYAGVGKSAGLTGGKSVTLKPYGLT